MGARLADDEVVGQRIVLAALIAGDHPGRHPGAAHQGDKGGGIVLAEAAAAVEEKFVNGLAAQERRAARVPVGLIAEKGQGGLHDARRGQGGPLAGQGAAARVAALRQLQA